LYKLHTFIYKFDRDRFTARLCVLPDRVYPSITNKIASLSCTIVLNNGNIMIKENWMHVKRCVFVFFAEFASLGDIFRYGRNNSPRAIGARNENLIFHIPSYVQIRYILIMGVKWGRWMLNLNSRFCLRWRLWTWEFRVLGRGVSIECRKHN
jgi:hypothetical protein